MQIKITENGSDGRRVDFHGNAVEGVWIDLVDVDGFTYKSKRITETERLRLIETLTRKDNGRSV